MGMGPSGSGPCQYSGPRLSFSNSYIISAEVGGHRPRTAEDPDLADLSLIVEREDGDELQHAAFYDAVEDPSDGRLVLDPEDGAELLLAITLRRCCEDALVNRFARCLGSEQGRDEGNVLGEGRDGRSVDPGYARPFRNVRGVAEVCVCEVRVDLRNPFADQCDVRPRTTVDVDGGDQLGGVVGDQGQHLCGVPVDGAGEHCPFQLVSLESKVGVGRAYDIRIGSERGYNRVATGDACQRQWSGEGNILCEGRWVVSQRGAEAQEYGSKLTGLLAAGHRGDAMALFMSTVGLPQEVIAGMRRSPGWQGMEALAPTLVYDAAVMGDSTVPTTLISSVKVPTLVLTGGNTGAWAESAARALTAALPFSEHRVLERQTHAVAWDVLATQLRRYFIGAKSIPQN